MTSAIKPAPLQLFYSYSHKDEALLKQLETHLKLLVRQGLIEDWHDRKIEVGSEWEPSILNNLERADLILLLVSPDFIASDYCWNKEMDRAMARHEEGTVRVIPIIVRPTVLKNAPFMKLQALPRDAKPIVQWGNEDEAWTNVAEGIWRVAEKMLKGRPRAPAASPTTSAPSAPATAATSGDFVPTAASLRKLMNEFLFGDDFDAFCSSYFPSVRKRFTSGMQHVARVTLLMDHADHAEILRGLREEYPAEVSKHEHLLRSR